MWKYEGSTSFFAEQVIADSIDQNESESDIKPVQTVTHYTRDELLLKLRESKNRSPNNSTCTKLAEIGHKIGEKKSASTVYYPYCGADVTHVFLLFPHCTTMVGFGRDDFGGIEDLNYYNENDEFISVPVSYANGFDSHKYHEAKGYKYLDNKYKVCPDILLRITQILGGEIISVEKTKVGEGKEDCIYQIDFMLDNLKRTFIYAKYEVNFNQLLLTSSSPVRNYLVSQSPDALLLKAIPDVLLSCEDGLALALASVSKEEQIVLSDARTYNWDKFFHKKDEPQPVFLKNAQLDSMALPSSFGYGTTLFIGNGSQLQHSQSVENQLEQTDAEVKPAITEPTKEQVKKSERTVRTEEEEQKTCQNPQKVTHKTNKLIPVEQPKTSSTKSRFNVHHVTLFAPMMELYKKLNKGASRKEMDDREDKNTSPQLEHHN